MSAGPPPPGETAPGATIPTAASAELPVFVSAGAEDPLPVPEAAGPPKLDVGPEEPVLPVVYQWIKRFLERHANKLWWLHSLYAMGLGTFVVLYAQKGYDHARWLTVSLGAGWIVLLVFFRIYGTGDVQAQRRGAGRRAKVSFYVMTYVLKNLYQGMLFFLLPFYWRTAVLDAPTRWFVLALAILAVLSTLDVVFDQFLMRWKLGASIAYFFILFACLDLVIPALLPDTRAVLSLMGAAAIAAIVFWTMHTPLSAFLRPAGVLLFMLAVSTAVATAYFGRRVIPPVPMHVATGAVGPELLPDGRLAMHVSTLHRDFIREMHALTDVVTPGGRGERLFHVWRHEGVEVQRGAIEPSGDPPPGTVRLRSTLHALDLDEDISGEWSVDVVTEDDQLIGRVSFLVID